MGGIFAGWRTATAKQKKRGHTMVNQSKYNRVREPKPRARLRKAKECLYHGRRDDARPAPTLRVKLPPCDRFVTG